MALDIVNYLDRITELQQVITPGAYAAPVAIHSQGDFPYWTNLVEPMTPTSGYGYNYFEYQIIVVMRLMRGVWSEGESTQLERVCYQDAPVVMSKFLSNPSLVTSTYTTAQAGFRPGSLSITATPFIIVNGDAVGSEYRLQFSHIEQEYETL